MSARHQGVIQVSRDEEVEVCLVGTDVIQSNNVGHLEFVGGGRLPGATGAEMTGGPLRGLVKRLMTESNTEWRFLISSHDVSGLGIS
jgi:hypothetical protein